MHGVDVGVYVVEADRSTTETHSPAVGNLRRQLESRRPHGLLPGVKGSIAAIFLEVGVGALSQEDTPRGLEGATRLVEAVGKPARALCQIAAGIKAAAPLPAGRTVGIADGAPRSRRPARRRNGLAKSLAGRPGRGGG